MFYNFEWITNKISCNLCTNRGVYISVGVVTKIFSHRFVDIKKCETVRKWDNHLATETFEFAFSYLFEILLRRWGHDSSFDSLERIEYHINSDTCHSTCYSVVNISHLFFSKRLLLDKLFVGFFIKLKCRNINSCLKVIVFELNYILVFTPLKSLKYQCFFSKFAMNFSLLGSFNFTGLNSFHHTIRKACFLFFTEILINIFVFIEDYTWFNTLKTDFSEMFD